jgi:hypothetical protein
MYTALRAAAVAALLLASALSSPAQDTNRLRSETTANVLWQWDNNPRSCLAALSYASTNRGEALSRLKGGQRHNRNVQRLYEVAAASLPDFWMIVATASNSGANFDEARVNINWQFSNNVTSLHNARRMWRSGHQIHALYELLQGQRHNVGVMNLYRACFRQDRERLFRIVNEILGN